MAKLNKTEIDTLATKITNELSQPIRKQNIEIREKAIEAFYKTKEGKMVKKLLDIDPNYISKVKINGRLSYKTKPLPSFNSVRVEIILAQIETDNLTELIETVKNKFIDGQQ